MTTPASFDTARFGLVAFDDLDVVTLPEGLLGFPECRRFLVLLHKEGSRFRWLQSLEDPRLAFLVVDPGEYFADYAPALDDADAADLGLSVETPRLVYTIVTIPQGRPEAMTVNLAGPIVINLETRFGRQVVVEDPAYGIKHPLGVVTERSAA